MGTIELVSVYEDPASYGILHDLLAERTPEQSISHKELPPYSEHIDFVDSKPYKAWYLIIEESEGYVGSVYLSRKNEIGVFIFNAHQGHGYGKAAVLELMRICPLSTGSKSIVAEKYLANINPKNEYSRKMFEELGFKHIQDTYAKE